MENGTITDKQLRYLAYLKSRVGNAKYNEILQKVGLQENVEVSKLTSEEAGKVIDELRNLVEGTKQTFEDKMKDYIDFETLLKEAHKHLGNFSIETELVNMTESELIIFKATVKVKDGDIERIFTAHGDAHPSNVNEMMKKHLLRVAESRAVVRALRFALGVGKTAKEEIEG